MSQDLEISAERGTWRLWQESMQNSTKRRWCLGSKKWCPESTLQSLGRSLHSKVRAEVSVSQFISSNFHFVSIKESQAKCWKKTWFNWFLWHNLQMPALSGQESGSKELCIPLPQEGQPQTETWRHTRSSAPPYLQSPHWKRCSGFLIISAHAAKILKRQTGTHSWNTQFKLLSSHSSTGDNKQNTSGQQRCLRKGERKRAHISRW